MKNMAVLRACWSTLLGHCAKGEVYNFTMRRTDARHWTMGLGSIPGLGAKSGAETTTTQTSLSSKMHELALTPSRRREPGAHRHITRVEFPDATPAVALVFQMHNTTGHITQISVAAWREVEDIMRREECAADSCVVKYDLLVAGFPI